MLGFSLLDLFDLSLVLKYSTMFTSLSLTVTCLTFGAKQVVLTAF